MILAWREATISCTWVNLMPPCSQGRAKAALSGLSVAELPPTNPLRHEASSLACGSDMGMRVACYVTLEAWTSLAT